MTLQRSLTLGRIAHYTMAIIGPARQMEHGMLLLEHFFFIRIRPQKFSSYTELVPGVDTSSKVGLGDGMVGTTKCKVLA